MSRLRRMFSRKACAPGAVATDGTTAATTTTTTTEAALAATAAAASATTTITAPSTSTTTTTTTKTSTTSADADPRFAVTTTNAIAAVTSTSALMRLNSAHDSTQHSGGRRRRIGVCSTGSSYVNLDSELDSDMDRLVLTALAPPPERQPLLPMMMTTTTSTSTARTPAAHAALSSSTSLPPPPPRFSSSQAAVTAAAAAAAAMVGKSLSAQDTASTKSLNHAENNNINKNSSSSSNNNINYIYNNMDRSNKINHNMDNNDKINHNMDNNDKINHNMDNNRINHNNNMDNNDKINHNNNNDKINHNNNNNNNDDSTILLMHDGHGFVRTPTITLVDDTGAPVAFPSTLAAAANVAAISVGSPAAGNPPVAAGVNDSMRTVPQSAVQPTPPVVIVVGSSSGSSSAVSSSLDEEGTASDSQEEGQRRDTTANGVTMLANQNQTSSFVGIDPSGVSPLDPSEVAGVSGVPGGSSDGRRGLIAPGPKVMPIPPTPRSVSMILPPKSSESIGDSTDEQDDDVQTSEALIADTVVNGGSGVIIVGPRASDDSGIGGPNGTAAVVAASGAGSIVGGASLKRSLHIDLATSARPMISRASSYGGSVSSLPITPKGGTVGPRHIGPNDRESLVIILSALYAKLLIVLGICFPMAEVISRRIPPAVYEGFYLYLYLGSISFLLFMYCFVFPHQKAKRGPRRNNSRISEYTASMMDKFRSITKTKADKANRAPAYELKTSHAGSFYLRLGAVAFGTGSMIYSGLEFGQFFEYESTDQCSILHNLTPATRMAFTFFQLYFIFINSRVAINRFTTLARFGLMHMISSNMCVWLHVLIQETKHQILDLGSNESHNPSRSAAETLVPNTTEAIQPNASYVKLAMAEAVEHVKRTRRSFPDSYCGQRANIMGELVQNASPFLFPCTIEYSLICAGVLYIMWKNVGSSRIVFNDSASVVTYAGRQRHYYQVDCAKANKGLFTGLLVLVLSIISLILFFVLINKPGYRNIAVLEAHIAELMVYVLASLATVTALFQVRELRYNRSRNLDLESILLIVAQSGLYLYNVFSIIGGHFDAGESTMLAILTALACLIQGSLQTMFILDASRRYVASHDQAERKPGREMVTFLILCNFSMWAINTLETRRADSNPVQMHFYGFWAWTIITHVTAPLVIFFRFHSTVCLCDIWKRAYKVKSDYLT